MLTELRHSFCNNMSPTVDPMAGTVKRETTATMTGTVPWPAMWCTNST